jgi:hypothetical protein
MGSRVEYARKGGGEGVDLCKIGWVVYSFVISQYVNTYTNTYTYNMDGHTSVDSVRANRILDLVQRLRIPVALAARLVHQAPGVDVTVQEEQAVMVEVHVIEREGVEEVIMSEEEEEEAEDENEIMIIENEEEEVNIIREIILIEEEEEIIFIGDEEEEIIIMGDEEEEVIIIGDAE